jgi:hypothetical protein
MNLRRKTAWKTQRHRQETLHSSTLTRMQGVWRHLHTTKFCTRRKWASGRLYICPLDVCLEYNSELLCSTVHRTPAVNSVTRDYRLS